MNKTKGINVLSLFDGMSCGRVALDRMDVKIKNYVASEVDKYAIKVAATNFPDTQHMGSVTELDFQNGTVYNWMDEIELDKVDMFIGGSPCQSFSFAGSRKGMVTKDNVEILTLEHYLQLKEDGFEFQGQSYLFWEYVRLLRDVQKENPDVIFLLENVKMAKKWQDLISSVLGVEPIVINSALVSAQNRVRLYWTNIKGITQPEDRGILLPSILENGVSDRDKSYCLDANYWKGTTLEQYLTKSRRQVVFTERRTEEAKRMRSEFMRLHNRDFSPRRAKELVARTDDKCNCLTTSLTKEHILLDEANVFRKLTTVECERLQGVPDGYTSCVSNSQAYKMLGNGWQIDTIEHIFSFIPWQ